jgi:hypothetical protein
MTGLLWPLHVFGGIAWLLLTVAALALPLGDRVRKALTGVSHLFMAIVLVTGFWALVARGGLVVGTTPYESVVLVKIVAALGLAGVIFAGARARREGNSERARLLRAVTVALVALIGFAVLYLLR